MSLKASASAATSSSGDVGLDALPGASGSIFRITDVRRSSGASARCSMPRKTSIVTAKPLTMITSCSVVVGTDTRMGARISTATARPDTAA